MVLIAGLDEAGRGPVIGPLVVAGVLINEKDIDKLKSLGVKDSKLLTPKQREELFEPILKIAKDHKIITVQPQEIDKAVDSKLTNLNKLETEKFAIIINYLKPNRAIIDCPSTNIKKFKEYLRVFLKQKTNLTCEHKADLNYPAVAAASVIAKVTRDREIEKLKEKYKIDFGSGYPSDPITQDFLNKNWNKHPELFRKSWSSYKKFIKEEKQFKLKEF